MRILVPAGSGLGAGELAALRRMSRPSLAIIVDELRDPESRQTVRWILRQRDPERALADAISENVRQASLALSRGGLSSYEAGLGVSFFKKLARIHRKIFDAVKKVNAKIAKIDPIYKATAKIRKQVMVQVRKYAPIIITVAGAVLASFTGGASVAAAAVLATAYELYQKRQAAIKAVKAGNKEAAAMQAQVKQQEAQVNQQADQVYAQNQIVFQSAGYDQAKWNALTLDQKVDLINQASNGTLKPTPEAIAAQQAAQQQIVDSAAQTAASTAAQQIASPPPAGGAPSSTGYSQPDASAPSSAPVQAAPLPQQTDETAGLPSASGYTVTVEGQTITNYPVKSAADLSGIIASGTQPGDRFEILADGQPTGLRVRTQAGYISIPESMRAQVMAMPHDQVLALLTQAAQNVADQGGPSGPAPAPAPSRGGFPVWGWLLLAGGGAAALAGGKRR